MAGFYGNITNTARTQFQFDAIYPNRYAMDRNVHTDGIYIGRYVLVEYDQDYNAKENFTEVFINDSGEFQWHKKLASGELSSRLTTITQNELGTFTFDGQTITPIVYVEDKDTGAITFYKITSERDFDNSNTKEVPTFEVCSIMDKETSNYGENFTIDKLTYGIDRGYDSTVWMKSYIDGEEKYISIAELNTVVPTFDVFPDAPRMIPIKPHFDKQATNLYYPLHWQTSWGFRVKEAENKNYSDEEVSYTASTYDEETGVEIKQDTTTDYKGAIFYNKAGFSSKNRSVIKDIEDKVSIEPTGISGNTYIDHTEEEKGNYKVLKPQPDILELSVMLPSLGNAVAEMWDIVYGIERNQDISWKWVDGTSDENALDLKTVAGCINSIHKLMGMIIAKKENIEATEVNYNLHYIYKDTSGKYWRIAKEQKYDTSNGETIGKEANITYNFVEIPNVNEKLKTIYGCILQMNELLGIGLSDTRDRATIQGCINTINDIINLFENQFAASSPLIMTSDKHIASADWETKQNYIIDNWGTNEATSGVDEQWIACEVDGANKKVKIYHQAHSAETTNKNSDMNSSETSNVVVDKNTIQTQVPIVDNTGHIVGKHIEKTTLPYGFKSIGLGIASNSVDNALINAEAVSFAANSTQDHFTINPSNKWIGIFGKDKGIKIGHIIPSETVKGNYGIGEDKSSDNNGAIDFNIPHISVDEAGHIISIKNTNISFSKVNEALLTGYEKESNDASYIEATDSIVNAFSKLQQQVKNEVSVRENEIDRLENTVIVNTKNELSSAINNEASTARAAEKANTTAISEEAIRAKGIEDGLDERLSAAENTITTHATNISDLDSKIDEEIADRNTAIEAEIARATAKENELNDKIDALDMEEAAIENQYISAVKQENGLISVEKATLPDYTERFEDIEEKATTLEDKLYKVAETDDETSGDIVSLKLKVDVLESEVSALKEALTSANEAIEVLKARLDALENTEEPTPDPDPEPSPEE